MKYTEMPITAANDTAVNVHRFHVMRSCGHAFEARRSAFANLPTRDDLVNQPPNEEFGFGGLCMRKRKGPEQRSGPVLSHDTTVTGSLNGP